VRAFGHQKGLESEPRSLGQVQYSKVLYSTVRYISGMTLAIARNVPHLYLSMMRRASSKGSLPDPLLLLLEDVLFEK